MQKVEAPRKILAKIVFVALAGYKIRLHLKVTLDAARKKMEESEAASYSTGSKSRSKRRKTANTAQAEIQDLSFNITCSVYNLVNAYLTKGREKV